MAKNDPLGRLVTIPLPVRLDGRGACWIGCSRATADFFQLWKLPVPEALVRDRAPDGRVALTCTTFHPNFGGTPYSFGMRERNPSGNRVYYRFRLTTNHRRETLVLLRDHVDALGIDWYGVLGDRGRTLSTCFLSQTAAAPLRAA